MNPNGHEGRKKFDVDDEILKLWSNLGKEFSAIKTETTINPPTVSAKTPKQEELEIPNFRKKTSESSSQVPKSGEPIIPQFTENTIRKEPEGARQKLKMPPSVSGKPIAEEAKKTSSSLSDNYGEIVAKPNGDLNIPTVSEGSNSLLREPEIPDFHKPNSAPINIEARNKIDKRKKLQETGKKSLETLQSSKKLWKQVSGVIGENVDAFRSHTQEFYEAKKTNLDKKYQIFEDKRHENKKQNHNRGQKAIAVLAVALTVGGVGTFGYRERKKNQPISTQETAAGIIQQDSSRETKDRESLSFVNKDGDEIVATFETTENRNQTNEDVSDGNETAATPVSETTTKVAPKTATEATSTSADYVSEAEARQATSQEKPTEGPNTVTESTTENHQERKLFSGENISSKEAYENITSLLTSGEYQNIDANCTADYFAEICRRVGFSANQTAAMLANGGHESQWCALLKQVGGKGFGFFQFDGANMYGKKGDDYYNDGNRMTYDGYKEHMRKIDPEVYDYCFNNNPFEKVGYEVDDNKIESILEETGTKGLYLRTLVRQLQYIYYVTQEDSWENGQMNKVKNSSTAYDCAWNFAKFVERPADTSDSAMGKRASTGAKIFNMLQKGLSLFEADPKM